MNERLKDVEGVGPHTHTHEGMTPCEENHSCWLVTYLSRDDGTWGIEIKHGEEGERILVCQSYPWASAEEAQSKAQFIMSEIDAAIVTGTKIKKEAMEYFKIHPPVNYPKPR